MKSYLLLGALVLSCMTPACGGSADDDDKDDVAGGGDSCGKVAACGGDITGEWTAVDSCLSFPGGVGATCPESTVDTSGLKVSGSISFKSDGTYTLSSVASGNVVVTFPPACLSQNGGPEITCEQLTMATAGTENEMKCTDASGGGCACTVTAESITTMDTGTYKVNGSTVTTTHDGETEEQSYCVSGGNLHLMPSSSTGMGNTGITGAIVFSRK